MKNRIVTALRWRLEVARQTFHGYRKARGERPRTYGEAYARWNRDCRWRRNCFRCDDQIGWRYLSTQYARIQNGDAYHVVRTNDQGWRADRNYSQERQEGRKRIAIVGDSYTAGNGVYNADRYSDLLEKRFPNIDVLNFGMANTGTDQQLLVLRHALSTYTCDAIIWGICVENVFRNLQVCRPSVEWSTGRVRYRAKPHFRLEEESLVLHSVPVPRAVRTEEDLGDWRDGKPTLVSVDTLNQVYAAESTSWKLMRAILRAPRADGCELPILYLPLPLRAQFVRDETPAHVARFPELHEPERGLFVLDVMSCFQELAPEERRACSLGGDPHYSPLGHEIVADAVGRALRTFMPELMQEGQL